MNNIFKGFALAVSMMTSIPFFKVHDFNKGINGFAVMAYPLVGLFLGLILFGIHSLLDTHVPDLHLGIIIFVLWIGLTGCGSEDAPKDATDTPTVSTTPAETKPHARPMIEIVPPAADDKTWQDAIQMVANQKYSSRARYTLMRVVQVDPTPNKIVFLSASQLLELTSNGGGNASIYFRAKNGDFVLWRHILSRNSQPDGPMSLKIGSLKTGTIEKMVEVPEKGKLQILGDIVMHTCPKDKYGNLQIEIEKDESITTNKVTIGATVVGGIYGTNYPLTADGKSEIISLPPGHYKILFPNFDMRKSRWEFDIQTGKITLLKLKAPSQKELNMIQ